MPLSIPLPNPQVSLYLRIRFEEGRFHYTLFGTPDLQAQPILATTLDIRVHEVETLSQSLSAEIQSPKDPVGNAESHLKAWGTQLFERLFPPPLASHLRHSNREFLVLDVDSASSAWPWEMAHDGKEFLGCRFSVGRKIGFKKSSPLVRSTRPSKVASFLILSNPDGDLPGASDESAGLSEVLSKESNAEVNWCNGRIAVADLLELASQADVLHFAGHSLGGSEGSSEAGWILSDAILRPTDLEALWQSGQSPPSVVFSNSCRSAETGGVARFQSEGSPTGLAGAFLAGGCRHFIGTMGEICDQSGHLFARFFYQHLLHGESVGTALRRARLDLRATPCRQPLTWAQYRLYGQPQLGLFGEEAVSVENATVLLAGKRSSPVPEESSEESHGREDFGNLLEGILSGFPGSEIVKDESSNSALLFKRPSEAVRCALLLQSQARNSDPLRAGPMLVKVAVSSGELTVKRSEDSGQALDIDGFPVRVAEQILALSGEGQILTTRPVFDDARVVLRPNESPVLNPISWLAHGPYEFEELDSPLEVCEVGEQDSAPLLAPVSTAKAHRFYSPEQDPVLGWRPALDLEIPTSPRWVLTEKLGEGGFGEVWRACHRHSGNSRVFKFCFQADRVRSLKREASLFELLRRNVGVHPNIVQVLGTYFDEPPYYIQMEYVEGLNLEEWFARRSELGLVPLQLRLNLVAKIAEAIQVAHNAGVIHRDIKPSNVLVVEDLSSSGEPEIKITDFGIGQVESREYLKGGLAGFTETYSGTELASHSGSRLYMAPEVLIGKPSTIASDVYSLGVLLYQVAISDFHRPLPTDWGNDIQDPLLCEDLERCLSGSPERRLGSARHLAERLRNYPQRDQARRERLAQEEKERRRKRYFRRVMVASLVLLATTAVLSLILWNSETSRRKIERQFYVSSIQAAKSDIDSGRFGSALKNLIACPVGLRHWEWGHLLYLCNPEMLCLEGHEGKVRAVALDPSGTEVASAGLDGNLYLWDLSTGIQKRVLKRKQAPLYQVTYSAEGDRLFFSGENGLLEIWDTHTWKKIQDLTQPENGATFFALHPDQGRLACGGVNGHIQIWDLERKSKVEEFETNLGRIYQLAFSPDGSLLASSHYPFAFRKGVEERYRVGVWDSQSGAHLHTLSEATTEVRCLQFTPDGNQLLTGSGAGELRFYEVDTWQMSRMDGPFGFGGLWSIRFFPDRPFLFLTFTKEAAMEWDLDRKVPGTIFKGHSGIVYDSAISHDGKVAITSGGDRKIKVWPIKSLSPQWKSNPAPEKLNALAYSPDGSILAGAGGNWIRDVTAYSIPLYNSVDGAEIKRLEGHTGVIWDLQFSPDGKTLASSSNDRTIRLWAIPSGTLLSTLKFHPEHAFCIHFNPTGETLLAGFSDGTLREFDLERFEEKRRWQAHSEAIGGLDLSQDGQLLVSGGRDGFVKVWSLRRAELRWDRPAGNEEEMRRAAFKEAPDDLREIQTNHWTDAVRFFDRDRQVVSGCWGGRLRRWEVESGRMIGEIEAELQKVFQIEVTRDDRRLAISGNVIVVWDLVTSRPLVTFAGGHGWGLEVGFDPANRNLAIGYYDGLLQVLPSYPYDDELSNQLAPGEDTAAVLGEMRKRFWKQFDSAGRVAEATSSG